MTRQSWNPGYPGWWAAGCDQMRSLCPRDILLWIHAKVGVGGSGRLVSSFHSLGTNKQGRHGNLGKLAAIPSRVFSRFLTEPASRFTLALRSPHLRCSCLDS